MTAGLAVVGGDDADPKIQLLFADGDLDPPVLGASSFGDVHFGQNLDARQNRPQQTSGRAVPFHQDAVNSVSNAHAILEGLDVDIRRPQLNGFLNHHADQPHDGSTGFVDQLFGLAAILGGFRKVDLRIGELLEDRVSRFAFHLAVIAVDRFLDRLSGG